MAEFAPWKHDRRRAWQRQAWALGLLAPALLAASFAHYWVALVFILAAVGLHRSAGVLWRRAARREYGKQVEIVATRNAVDALKGSGLSVRTNVMVRGIGDIDLVVERGGQAIPVEIKSFVKWNQFLWVVGEREGRAYSQVSRQMKALGARQGIIWLPNGRPTAWQRIFPPSYGGVRVIFGAARQIARSV